jgi:hypothetical protein
VKNEFLIALKDTQITPQVSLFSSKSKKTLFDKRYLVKKGDVNDVSESKRTSPV